MNELKVFSSTEFGELGADELSPIKPYTAERAAEIAEINSDTAFGAMSYKITDFLYKPPKAAF